VNAEAPPSTLVRATPKRRIGRGWWLRQLHTWHWISAAVALAGMLMFALTGLTLNHADLIPATPRVVDRSATLAPSLVRLLKQTPRASDAPMPTPVAEAVASAVGLDPGGRPAEWSDGEVYVAMPRPGGDAWVSVDRASGAIRAETTDQGLIALLNDLHKGRNTGLAWRLFIDLFAAAAIFFTGTGLLLLQLHAKHRRETWPLVGLGLAVPLILFIVFVH
jgi:uncharacterized protein